MVFVRIRNLSAFNRNVAIVASGTVISQVIPLLASPAISRLYEPADFGRFALYFAIVTVLGSIVTGQYELAINVPKEHNQARDIVATCFRVAAAVASATLAVAILFRDQIAEQFGGEFLSAWLLVAPMILMLVGASRAYNYWLNRHREFKGLSYARVTQAAAVAVATIAFAWLAPNETGLILAAILGRVVYLASFIGLARKAGLPPLRRSTAAGRREQRRRFRKFPLMQAPEALLTTSTSQVPIVLLTAFFGAAPAGLFVLAQRTIRAPVNVLSSSIAEVFRQQMSEDLAQNRSAEPLFWATFRKLVVVAILPFVAILIAAPTLFAFVFGEEWRAAGDYARIMVPMLGSSFLVQPLSLSIIVAEKHAWDLSIQAGGFVVGVAVLWIGYRWFGSDRIALLLFSCASAFKSAVEFRFALLAARGHDRHFEHGHIALCVWPD